MNSKERFEFYKENIPAFDRSAEDTIQDLVNTLIESLYIPVKKRNNITIVDNARLKHFGIDGTEPINWGDLKCNEVKKLEDGSFLVVIDEASPDDCETFCDYIQEYMLSYGWQIKVETEW